MSGYLEVKYPFRSNLGLNPFKSWKRQWCILRPSPTSSGGSLAVYCSEAGAAAGCVELPFGCVVRRAKSRSRPHAFAIFSADEPCKPRVLLASQTFHDAQIWMDKIRSLLNDSKLLGTETPVKDSYSVTVVATDLSRKCGLSGADGTATVSTSGLLVSRTHKLGVFVDWKHISTVLQSEQEDKSKMCVVCVDSDFSSGGGELKFSSPLAAELVIALKRVISNTTRGRKKLSKSEGDLRKAKCSNDELQRSIWYSGPSEVSLDDMDLVMSKDSKRITSGQLSRCTGAGDLALRPVAASAPASAFTLTSSPTSASALESTPTSASTIASTVPRMVSNELQPLETHCDDSFSDRRSMVSVASGIYEEIPDIPEGQAPAETLYCKMGRDIPDSPRFKMSETDALVRLEEPTYESVAECVYATMRRAARRHPPPLPPRMPFGSVKLGESWNSRVHCCHGNVTRHSSLCSLPQCCPHVDNIDKPRSLPRWDKSRQAFSVFRKRLKSDSRIASSPKSETSKENKDVETKKKKFDFTPTRDIFKNFKVSRKMKNLKITNLNKGETKSCEFLDETEHVTTDRCSKSVECLEDNHEFSNEYNADLSIEFNDDAVEALSLPQEIVQLLLASEHITKVRLKEDESEYIPMSPIVPSLPMEHHYIAMSPIVPPPPMEHDYITMSPRTNIA